MRTYIWPVSGMHCASCERLVGDALKKLPGVVEVDVSLKKRKAGIRLADGAPEPDLACVNKELLSLGYHVGDASADPALCAMPDKATSWKRRILEAVGILAIVLLVLNVVVLPLLKLMPTVSATGSLLALFGLGVVASVSTCLTATGAFLLAFTSVNPARRNVFWIHLGRLVTFVVGGGLLGAIGSAVPSGSLLYGLVGLLLGAGFLMVGLHLMDLTPSLASLGIRLPKGIGQVADRVKTATGPTAPFLVGAVTFVLPCGFTQTAQALALSTGSLTRGALLMFAFALGTAPVLIGVTKMGSIAALRHRALRLVTGALLLIFAVGQLDGGLTVLGSPVTISGLVRRTVSVVNPTTVLPAQAQEQTISMNVAYGAFSPNQFTIKRGIPVRWEVHSIDISGCASSIVVPKLAIRRDLTTGLNVIEFTPTNVGELPFSCSMGMIRGSFNVVE